MVQMCLGGVSRDLGGAAYIFYHIKGSDGGIFVITQRSSSSGECSIDYDRCVQSVALPTEKTCEV